MTTGGFGDPANQDILLGPVFHGELYAGTMNMNGCEVWRLTTSGWNQVVGQGASGPTAHGFGNAHNCAIDAMLPHGSGLYIGTWNYTDGCSVWRYSSGSFTQIVGQRASGPTAPGFGDASNFSAMSLMEYDSHIYIGTDNPPDGCEVWTYDGSNLEQVVGQGASGPTAPGFGNTDNSDVSGWIVRGSRLYAGVGNHVDGCGIFSTKSSTTW